jgi:hypothetical protein
MNSTKQISLQILYCYLSGCDIGIIVGGYERFGEHAAKPRYSATLS